MYLMTLSLVDGTNALSVHTKQTSKQRALDHPNSVEFIHYGTIPILRKLSSVKPGMHVLTVAEQLVSLYLF